MELFELFIRSKVATAGVGHPSTDRGALLIGQMIDAAAT